MGNRNSSRKIVKKASAASPSAPSLNLSSSSGRSFSSRSSVGSFLRFDNKVVATDYTHSNGVIGKYISHRLLRIAGTFWLRNVESLDPDTKMEIACCLFCGMVSYGKEMKPITAKMITHSINLKMQSLKILAMISYLIRNMFCDGIDLFAMLQQLGPLHLQFGVKMLHFNIMIKSLHETMSYYFPKEYNIDVQYAMDKLISVSGQIMTNEIVKGGRTRSFHGAQTYFLSSLESCLSSEIGSEYFFNYLQNKYCAEMVTYLQLIKQFRKPQLTDKQRLVVTAELIETCIEESGKNAINISYESRKELLDGYRVLAAQKGKIPIEFFDSADLEVRRLILQNHWFRFVDSIGRLRNSVSIQVTENGKITIDQ